MLVALSGVAMAAPGGTRPGWGCGDENHDHSGPPGHGSSSGDHCQNGQGNDNGQGDENDNGQGDENGHGEHNEHNGQHPAAIRLTISAPGSTSAGSTFNITVTAVDGSGNTQSSFADTVHFTSSDGQASLPVDTTLSNGVSTFGVTLRSAGGQTVTANDASNSSVDSGSATVNVTALTATHLALSSVPTAVSSGAGFTFAVTAQDQFNNTATGYADTVRITSSDGAATLPADSTLSNGTGNFTVTLRTAGNPTITASDISNGSIASASAGISVS
jgi:hypothetical protein